MGRDALFRLELERAPFEVLPGGETIEIHELSAKDRVLLHELAQENPIEGQAKICILGCDALSDADMEAIQGLPGQVVQEMADAILRLSKLGADGVEDAKNA